MPCWRDNTVQRRACIAPQYKSDSNPATTDIHTSAYNWNMLGTCLTYGWYMLYDWFISGICLENTCHIGQRQDTVFSQHLAFGLYGMYFAAVGWRRRGRRPRRRWSKFSRGGPEAKIFCTIKSMHCQEWIKLRDGYGSRIYFCATKLCQSFSKFVLETQSIDAPVNFWIFSSWTGSQGQGVKFECNYVSYNAVYDLLVS
jgi:hypothetical protein